MARLSFYGGVGEIGGNKFLLEDKAGRTRLLLDFGLQFKVSNAYWGEFHQPRKGRALADWFATRLLPRMEGWEGIYRQDHLGKLGVTPEKERRLDGVLLSHAHADHANMFHFLRPDIPLVMTPGSFRVLRANQDLANTMADLVEWQEEFQFAAKKRGEGFKKVEGKDRKREPRPIVHPHGKRVDVGDAKVHQFDIDHSLPGAAAYIVELDDVSVAYTGDIRFHGHNGALSKAFVAKARELDLDYLITEGTNVGEAGKPRKRQTSEAEVEQQIEALIRGAGKMVLASWPVRDTDRMWSFLRAAKAAGRKLAVSLKQAYYLEQLAAAGADAPRLSDKDVVVFVPQKGWCIKGDDRFPEGLWETDYDPWERDIMDREAHVLADDVRESPEDYVVRVDFFELKNLIDLQPEPGSVYIRSQTQPFDEETELDLKKVFNWLELFQLEVHEPHASGHASVDELEWMIQELAPRKVIPIHTEHPEAYGSFVSGTSIEVLTPKLRNGDNIFEL